MRQFQWSPENEVFIGQIDAEHRDLYEVAEAFEQAVEKKSGGDIQHQLHLLAEHMEEHFSHEEWLMQSVGYPSYAWHKNQHETARRRFKLFAALIQSGNQDAIEMFLEFLAGWLHDHTTVTDRMMASFVRNYERSHATSAFERWGTPAKRSGVETRRRPPVNEVGPYPTTVRTCNICAEMTTHELRISGLVCVKCAERSVTAELDRD
jgi:hemerythrin